MFTRISGMFTKCFFSIFGACKNHKKRHLGDNSNPWLHTKSGKSFIHSLCIFTTRNFETRKIFSFTLPEKLYHENTYHLNFF